MEASTSGFLRVNVCKPRYSTRFLVARECLSRRIQVIPSSIASCDLVARQSNLTALHSAAAANRKDELRRPLATREGRTMAVPRTWRDV